MPTAPRDVAHRRRVEALLAEQPCRRAHEVGAAVGFAGSAPRSLRARRDEEGRFPGFHADTRGATRLQSNCLLGAAHRIARRRRTRNGVAAGQPGFLQVLQIVISGVAQGCIYGLIALGFVLIYKATETVSFVQGDLMMVGAFIGLACMTVSGFPVLARGAGVDRRHGAARLRDRAVVIRPILGEPAFSIVMLTVGIGYVARGLITMIPGIGTETHHCRYRTRTRPGASAGSCSTASSWSSSASLRLLCALLYVLFHYTQVGVAMQASRRRTSSRPTTWAFRSRALTRWSGRWRRWWRRLPAAAGADHLRARQHGLDRLEGLSGHDLDGGRLADRWQRSGIAEAPLRVAVLATLCAG